jgi:hypothetical protein
LGRHEETVLAVVDHFRYAADRRGDTGHAGGHRFQK